MRLIRKTGFMLLIDPRPCWFRTAIERQQYAAADEITAEIRIPVRGLRICQNIVDKVVRRE
jgi:hypothetical protein